MSTTDFEFKKDDLKRIINEAELSSSVDEVGYVDSISDGIALKRADVGICMGNGCEVAKENSDLILLDS